MNRSCLILAYIFLATIKLPGQHDPIDSLRTQFENLNKNAPSFSNDTSKIKTLIVLASKLNTEDPDTTLILYNQALQLARQIKWKFGIGNCEHQLGHYHWSKGDYSPALDNYKKALSIWNELSIRPENPLYLNARRLKIKTLGNMGLVYSEQGDYPSALTYYFMALKLAEELNDKLLISTVLGNLGIVYEQQADGPKALNYYFKALKIDEELKDRYSIATDLGNIGNIYYYQDELIKALEYYFRALKMSEELNDKPGIARHLGNIGNVYYDLEDYTKALDYYFRSLKIKEELGDKSRIVYWLTNIGSLYIKIGKFNEGEIYLKRSLALAESIGALEGVQYAHQKLSELYDSTGRPALAFLHYKKCIAVRDTINSVENQKKQVRSEMNYEFEKKELAAKAEQDRKDVIALEEKQKQQIILYAVIAGLSIVIIFSFLLYRRFKLTQRQKYIIEKQKEEAVLQKEIIEKQKHLVEEHQKEILDSIHYARRIQQALLPTQKYIAKSFDRLRKQ